MKNRGQLVSVGVIRRFNWRPGYLLLMSAATGRRSLLTARDPESHPIEPARDRALLADRGSLADQDQEACLKGIFGIMPFAQHRLADAEDHRAMALDEGGERKFGYLMIVIAGRETLE